MEIQPHRISWDDEKVSRLWNYYSMTPPYSEIYFSKLFGNKLIARSGLPLDQPLSVLDFGCGPGYIWDHLQSLDTRWMYTGVDFSADAVARLQQKAATNPRFASAQHITGLPISFPSSSFDAVFLFEVLEHLHEVYLEETMREVARLLKRGGVLVVSTPNEERLSDAEKFCPECGAIFHEWQHVRSWSLGSLTTYVEQNGFRIVNHDRLDFFATGLLQRLIRGIQIVLRKEIKRPHMIASFQKISGR